MLFMWKQRKDKNKLRRATTMVVGVVVVKRKPSNFLKQFWMSSRIHTWMWMASELLEMWLQWLTVELPQAILDVIQNPHLDVDDIRAAGNVALMVDDDNMPAVENIPQQDTNNNNNNNNIMSGWQHSGICKRRSAIRTNATPMLKSLNTSDEMNDPTNLQLFEALFFKSFIQSTIIPKMNENLGGREKSPMANSFVGWDFGL